MQIYDFRKYKFFVVGKFENNQAKIIRKQLSIPCEDLLIILCGNVGFGRFDEEETSKVLEEMNEIAKEYNSFIIFIRSNEDDPSYFDGRMMSNLLLAQDYSIIETSIGNLMCLGGSITYDRSWKISRFNYLKKKDTENKLKLKCQYFGEDEMTNLNQDILDELKNENIQIKFVVANDVPSKSIPMIDAIKDWISVDEHLKRDLEKQYETIDYIYKYLKENCNNEYWIGGKYNCESDDVISTASNTYILVQNSLRPKLLYYF